MNPNQCFIYYMIHWQGYYIHGQLWMFINFVLFKLFIIVKNNNTHSLFCIKVSCVVEQQQGTTALN